MHFITGFSSFHILLNTIMRWKGGYSAWCHRFLMTSRHFHLAIQMNPKSIHVPKKPLPRIPPVVNDSRCLFNHTYKWFGCKMLDLSYPSQADGSNHLWTISIGAARCAQRWKIGNWPVVLISTFCEMIQWSIRVLKWLYCLRATSHTSQEPWQWNYESPKKVSKGRSNTPPNSYSVIMDPQV